MVMALQRKGIAILIIIAALIGATFFFLPQKKSSNFPELYSERNNKQENPTKEIENTESSTNYFIESKLTRSRIYSQQIEQYQEILETLDSEAKKNVAQEIVKLNNKMEKEIELENILQAKGFSDVIVFLHSDSADVVVGSKGLMNEELAMTIGDLLKRSLGIDVSKVSIIEKKFK